MKKSEKQIAATCSGHHDTGFARSGNHHFSSSPSRLFGTGYTITEDVLM